MKALTTAVIIFLFYAATPAAALTIKNKCGYPVAGSVLVAESKVCLAQFRLIPGQSKQLLKGFDKMNLVVRTIPDVYDLDKLKISTTEVYNPDSYIELKQTKKGIRFKVQ
ncbi:hypothetical protein [Maridesulfovibrio sp.]|uniref:hypothetical protein n=1 Tax=Maridesulfovibrio sp. TaxID=2795000 RepID=UPI0029CA0350|nr:hypothetical protein [Maridesulfovibrio sp.]